MSGLDALAVAARTADDRPVGIAERDPSAHGEQLVDEEEAVLEHLLEDQDRTPRLGGEGEGDRGQVGRERRPGTVVDLRDRVAEVVPDLERLVRWHEHVVALDHRLQAEAREVAADRDQVVGLRHGSAARHGSPQRAP